MADTLTFTQLAGYIEPIVNKPGLIAELGADFAPEIGAKNPHLGTLIINEAQLVKAALRGRIQTALPDKVPCDSSVQYPKLNKQGGMGTGGLLAWRALDIPNKRGGVRKPLLATFLAAGGDIFYGVGTGKIPATKQRAAYRGAKLLGTAGTIPEASRLDEIYNQIPLTLIRLGIVNLALRHKIDVEKLMERLTKTPDNLG